MRKIAKMVSISDENLQLYEQNREFLVKKDKIYNFSAYIDALLRNDLKTLDAQRIAATTTQEMRQALAKNIVEYEQKAQQEKEKLSKIIKLQDKTEASKKQEKGLFL